MRNSETDVEQTGCERVSTSRFKVSQGLFFRIVLFRYLKLFVWIAGIVLVGLIVAGVLIDIRWLIIGLMFLFVVTPAIIAFIYIDFVLREECVPNLLPHSLDITPNGIAVEMFAKNFDDEDEEDEELKEPTERVVDKFISRDIITGLNQGMEGLTIFYTLKRKGFLFVPWEVFGGKENVEEAVRIIRS